MNVSPTQEDKFKGMMKIIGYQELVRWLPVVIYSWESIFEYEYRCECKAKIEQITVLREGPFVI